MNSFTVLLYCDVESNVERMTALAGKVAARMAARSHSSWATESSSHEPRKGLLIGTHATPLTVLYSGVSDAIDGGLALQQAESEHARTHRMRARFEHVAEEAGVDAEWHPLVDGDRGDSASLRERARSADLVIMPQPAEPGGDRFVEFAIRDVVTHAGRPVLVVPRVGKFTDIGSKLLIGWSPTREATRAVHDALLIAHPSARATLLWISHGSDPHGELEESAETMAAVIMRHGIECKVARSTKAEIAIGDVLLNESFERGADLLVTGGFGHSRIYDIVVGATTSHLLAHMTVPVLFAH